MNDRDYTSVWDFIATSLALVTTAAFALSVVLVFDAAAALLTWLWPWRRALAERPPLVLVR